MLMVDRFRTLFVVAWLSLAASITFGADGALAQEKKAIRINHAGADDIVGTEHQMFAWVFANYVNSKSPTLDVKIFPNSGLGSVAAGDRSHAARLRRQHTRWRHGRVRQLLQSQVRRHRPSLHLLGLRSRSARARWPGRCRAVPRNGSDRLQGDRISVFLGLPQRRYGKEGNQDGGGFEGSEDPHHSDAGLRRRRQCHGRVGNADEFRRSLYLAAKRRARRLRAHRDHDGVIQILRDRQVLCVDPASH